jgi:predicted nucleic acid-binding protein
LLVPSITIYEVYKRILREWGKTAADTVTQQMNQSRVIVLDGGLAISAVQYSGEYRLPMADSIIYATAMEYEATLWTADSHFKDLPHVKFFDKTAETTA